MFILVLDQDCKKSMLRSGARTQENSDTKYNGFITSDLDMSWDSAR